MTRTPGLPPLSSACTPGFIGFQVSDWYRMEHRLLPWRDTRDPYRILVSEVMLQQTRVETVVGYYSRFLESFPDVAALASADPERVMNLWKGLGYYSRARNLQKAAQRVMRELGGVFPDTVEGLRPLPGVGSYTMGAVMSIAFGKPVPAVDGNVLRVMSRLFLLEADIGLPAVKQDITVRVSEMIPEGCASDFCQGMMELGATVCTPSSPKCAVCPVMACCLAYASGKQASLPMKRVKPAPVESCQIVCVIRDAAGRVLMEYRQKGLLSGLWGLPHCESDRDHPDSEELPECLGMPFLELADAGEIGRITHVFTHRRWYMHAWAFTARNDVAAMVSLERFKWVEPVHLKDVPIPEAFQKVLRMAGLLQKDGDQL